MTKLTVFAEGEMYTRADGKREFDEEDPFQICLETFHPRLDTQQILL
jgi:hypothetical protein